MATPTFFDRSRAARKRERAVDMRRALHVDPEEVAECVGSVEKRDEMAPAERFVEVQAELGGLDGDLRVESGRLHTRHDIEIVRRDLVGFRRLGQVFAKSREDSGDSGDLELARRIYGVFDPLARHEPGD